MAVEVKCAHKKYGEKGPPVLSGLELSVEPGTIYGLLGPSGCGKTTLLSCIIGLEKLDSGDISIFGYRQGEEDCSIPGPGLGYMPQDAALYPNLNIKEILSHFGTIYGMSSSEIQVRTQFLLEFLNLPEPTRLIKSLSGGELRCVSLAVTMIHQPPFLILDEPTAGLDPILGRRIWEYLHEIVSLDKKTTVIVTTQYIPEAMFCDKIGIMRKGRILVEDSPLALLKKYGSNNLESVFLFLCKKDKNNQQQAVMRASLSSQNNKNSNLESEIIDNELQGVQLRSVQTYLEEKEHKEIQRDALKNRIRRRRCKDSAKIMTLVKKTTLRQARVPVNLVLLLFIPILLIFLINGIVGKNPKNLKLSYVFDGRKGGEDPCHQEEGGGVNSTKDLACLDKSHGSYACAYLRHLQNRFDIDLKFVESAEEALSLVHSGGSLGYVTFPANFSSKFMDRLSLHNFADEDTIKGSTIGVRLDMSNYVYSAFLRKAVIKSWALFAQESISKCGSDPRIIQLPLKYHSIYPHQEGSENKDSSEPLSWSQYYQPASMILIMAILSHAPAMMTAIEKRMGYMDRDYVAGIKFRHVIASILLHGSVIIILQMAATLSLLPLLFGMRPQGSWALVIFFVFFSSLSGVSIGALWGIVAKHEMEVVMMVLGLCVTCVFASGSIWPLETVSPYYRWVCEIMIPIAQPISGMRSVIYKGWELTHPEIFVRVGATIAWVVVPIVVASFFYMKRRGVGRDINK